MQKFITENFRFTITVTEAKPCRNGHEVGDAYSCEYGCPMPINDEDGFCAKAMLTLFPLLETVRAGGNLKTISGEAKHIINFACPNGGVRFRLEATDLMTIHPLTPEHLPAYADIVRRSFSTVAQEFGLEDCQGFSSNRTNEDFAKKLKDGYHPFGAFIGEKIIGFVSLDDIGEGVYELEKLSVLPEYRNFGYGKMLVDFCKRKAKELGGRKIIIKFMDEDKRLKDWYLGCGFIQVNAVKHNHMPYTVGYMEYMLLLA